MKNPFDYFDRIVCISVEHETERWAHAKSQFEQVGILDRVEKFDEVIDLDWVNSEFGGGWNRTDYCHYKIILDAHERGLENVFIFENDIHFTNMDLELMSKSIETLGYVDWKLFYMGGIVHNVYGVVSEHLINANVCQAHAYAINGKYCKEVADKLMKNKMPIDQVYRRSRKYGIGTHSFITYPMFVVQMAGLQESHRRSVAYTGWTSRVEPAMRKYKIQKELDELRGEVSDLDDGLANGEG